MTDISDLAALLDEASAVELARWADRTDRRVRVPARRWEERGFTTARVVQLYVTDPPRPPQLVVVKVLPAGHDAEAAAHRRAMREAPEPFRRHFVTQVFDSLTLPDGRTLTFQARAGCGTDWRPMSELAVPHLPAASRIVTASLISDWNPEFNVDPVGVLDILWAEVAARCSAAEIGLDAVDPTTPWLLTGDSRPILNPLHMIGPDSVFANERMDLAFGRVHGDLHGQNLLLPLLAEAVEFDSFILVDLMTYQSVGQLGQDPVSMLLSAAARLLPGLSEPHRQALLPRFVRPLAWVRQPIAPQLEDVVHAIYTSAADRLRDCGVWRLQYLLSLAAQGLSMAAFQNLGPALRWWFFRLAGHAGRELLTEFGRASEVAVDAPRLTNPFGADDNVVGLGGKLLGPQRQGYSIAVRGAFDSDAIAVPKGLTTVAS